MTQVILVNKLDEAIGEMEKLQAHKTAALHRAFSVFIFNGDGKMLLQKRALQKYHSTGLWTNACCSHPLPGENTKDAAARRLKEELGFTTDLTHAFTFSYQSAFENGLSENEIDHVFIGHYDGPVFANEEEVSHYHFQQMEAIKSKLHLEPNVFTSWFKIAFPLLETYLANTTL